MSSYAIIPFITIPSIITKFSLTVIDNIFTNDGITPIDSGKEISLFKSGDELFNYYRPVSLLPHFSKLLEKLFNNIPGRE